ncbi:MAG: MFS transporter [Pseudomonadota bacterium]
MSIDGESLPGSGAPAQIPADAEPATTPAAAPAAPAARADFGAWWMLAILFSLYVFSFIDRQIVSMLVPDIKADLNISDFQMGLILGPAFAIVYAVFGIPMGWLADRFSRRWLIFLGTCCFGLATFASGQANSFAVLLLARIAVGIGEASLTPAASSLLAARFPRHLLTTAFSIYTMGVKVGTAAAYAIGGVLIVSVGYWVAHIPALQGYHAWQIVFMATGLPAALLALLIFTVDDPPRPVVSKAAGQPTDSVVKHMWERKQLFVPMLVGFSLVAICNGSLVSWVPTYLNRTLKLSPVEYGPILGAISMAAALTLAFKGMVVDWLFHRGVKDAHLRFYTWLLAGSLPLVGLLFWVENALAFMVMYGVLLIVAIPIMAYVSAATTLIAPPSMRGRIIGVFLFFLSGLGVGVGPLLVGGITHFVFQDEAKLGWSLAIVICTVMPLAWVLLRMALKPFHAEILASEARESAVA